MIKCDVTVCGSVVRAAEMRSDREGKPYMSVALSVSVSNSLPNGERGAKVLTINATKDGDQHDLLSMFAVGSRVEVSGQLTFAKSGEDIRMQILGISPQSAPERDEIKGSMTFKGKTRKATSGHAGNLVKAGVNKKGAAYYTFSAFSTRKTGENDYDYTWVRFFVNGNPPEWLTWQTRIQAKGRLTVDAYNDRINLTCNAEELTQDMGSPQA